MLFETMHQFGGVARTSQLLARGASRHQITRAVERGQLLRIKHGWVSTPEAPPDLVFAAQHGLMLSCVSQAKRLELWVREHTHPHFAVPRPGAERRPHLATLHYRRPIVPRKPYSLADDVVNTLSLISHCLPHEDAVAVWDSALRKSLVSLPVLQRLPLSRRSLAVLADASMYADSGLESYVRQRLAWLRIRMIAQAWLLGHRVDFLLGNKLVLQIDGGHHVGPQRTADIAHDAALRLHGYTVIRVGYEQVMNNWHEVQELIMLAVAQGLHR